MKKLLAFIAATIGFASCIWAATTDLSTVKSNITLADDTAARFALHGRPAPKKLAELKAGKIQAKQTEGAKGVRLLQATGPSYPESIGGAKGYEYISSFTVTPKDGYYKITVKVICPQLYNAEGYPNYGGETEFVNIWIDWNGDYSWSASERVMAKSSANYKKILADNKILYFEATVKDASTVGGTFKARAMLGWGYNPTNPTTYSWAWGDVMDVGVTFKFEPPQLYSFRIKPSASVSVPESSNVAQMEGSKSPTKDNMVLAGEDAYIELYVKVRIADRNSPNFFHAVRVENMYFDDVIEKSGRLAQTPDEVDGEYGLYKVRNSLNGELMWYRGSNRIHEDAKYYGEQCLKVTVNCEGFDICQVPHYFPYYRYYPAKWLVALSATEKAKYGASMVPMWFYMWKEFITELEQFHYAVTMSWANELGECKDWWSTPIPSVKTDGAKADLTWHPLYYISSLAHDIQTEEVISKKTGLKQSKVDFPIDEVVRTVKHELKHGTLHKDNKTGTWRKKTDSTVASEADCWYVEIDGDAEGMPVRVLENGRWKWEWQDGDLLTAAREMEIKSKNEPEMTDTHEISKNNGWATYKAHGDQEYYVRWAVNSERASKYKHGGKKYTELDWSYPGAQTPANVSGWGVYSKKLTKKLSVSLNAGDIFNSDVLSAGEGAAVLNDNELFTASGKPGILFLSFADETDDFENQGLVLGVDIEHDLEGTWDFGAYLFGTNGMALAKAHTSAKIDADRSHISFVFSSDTMANVKDVYSGPFVLGRVECIVPQNSSANAKSAVNVLITKDYSAYECKVTKPFVGSAMSDYVDDKGIHVVMPVTVPSEGTYAISAHLATTNGEDLVNVTTNCVCAEGRNEIDICFPNRDVFNTKVTGRFMVRDISVAADDEEPSLFVCDYETNPYDYFDFGDEEKSIIIWPETVVLSASQDDDDSGEQYNGISVKFDADNQDYDDETLYRVSAVLVDTNGYNVAYAEEDMMVNGYATLSLFFSAQEIRESGKDGPYSVKWLKISDRETGEVIDACAVSDAKTDLLVSGDFKGGLLVDENAMQLSDMPIGNGLYAGLQLAVPMNVPSDGYVTLSAFVYTADGKLVERFESERAVVSGDNQLILDMDGAQFRDSGMDGPYVIRSIEVRHSSFPEHPYEVERVFNTDAYTHTQFFGLGRTRFEENVLQTDEGENVVVRISGGSTNVNSTVKVFLMYNTGVAADLDLANGTVDGVMPKGGLRFPLTLNWDVGEVGEKVVSIPVKTDKATENDEFFTLQLADPQGMELGVKRMCKVTIHDPRYDSLGERVATNSATPAEIKDWEKLQAAKAPYILGIADSANAGKVTGSGACAVNKKVTLKATANKGFVFVGWTDSQIAMDGDRIVSGAVPYLATTPSLVIDRSAKPTANSKTSTTITTVNDDVTYYANFVTVEEDKAAISLAVYGLNLPPLESGAMPVWTNICGVAVDWLVAAAGLSATTVKAAGLPQGLKLVQDKETGQYFVQGAPTAASKIDAKTGIVTPSKVSFTVTTAGKTSEVFGINLIVLPLPDWAQGTFTGVVDVSDDEGSSSYGFATMSVAANGKISGKMTLNGTNWTFGASCYAWRYNNSYMEDSDEYVFKSEVEAKSGKATKWFTIDVSSLSSSGAFANGVAYSWGNDVGLTMWRNMWKDKVTAAEAKAELAKWEGVYTLSFLPGDDYGSGYLSLTVGKDGNVKASGKLADGTSLSALSPLLYDVDVGYFAYLYMTSSAYKGGALSLAVGFDDGEGAVATQGVGAKLGGRLGIARWTSFNPQATGVYGEGFSREMAFVGAYYDKGMMLGEYYETLRLSMVAPALAYTYKETYLGENVKKVTVSSAATTTAVDTLWQSGLTVAVSDKGAFVVAKATKPVQDKETKEWSYVGDNDGALTLSFAQATGIFKGSYTFWYDYVSAEDETVEPAKATMAHTSKKVAFEGVLVPGMEAMRGFYLWDATGTYEDPKTGKEKTYKYKESHPVSLVEP